MNGLGTAASRFLCISGLGCVRGGRVVLRDLGLELGGGQLNLFAAAGHFVRVLVEHQVAHHQL